MDLLCGHCFLRRKKSLQLLESVHFHINRYLIPRGFIILEKLSALLILFCFVQDFDITVTYTDPSGAVRLRKVKGRDLSASWVLENPNNVNRDQPTSLEVL